MRDSFLQSVPTRWRFRLLWNAQERFGRVWHVIRYCKLYQNVLKLLTRMQSATNYPRLSLTANTLIGDGDFVPGRPFRSVLKPHLEFIRAARRADKSWQEIADALAREHGVKITGRGVNRFFAAIKRRTAWPLGMEPTSPASISAGGPHSMAPGRPSVLGSKRGQKAVPTSGPTGVLERSRSQLFPHMAFIAAQRSAGESWRQIAESLGARGIKVSHQAVSDFFKRTLEREARRRSETAIRQPGDGPTQPSTSPAPISPSKPFSDEGDHIDLMN